MAKYCPIVNHKVVYLECLECEDRQCEKRDHAPKNLCETCFHKIGTRDVFLFGAMRNCIQCDIFASRVFEGVETCEYYNVDVKNMRICMNCNHFIGMGDWGLACGANYYALPGPTSKACEKFVAKS